MANVAATDIRHQISAPRQNNHKNSMTEIRLLEKPIQVTVMILKVIRTGKYPHDIFKVSGWYGIKKFQ